MANINNNANRHSRIVWETSLEHDTESGFSSLSELNVIKPPTFDVNFPLFPITPLSLNFPILTSSISISEEENFTKIFQLLAEGREIKDIRKDLLKKTKRKDNFLKFLKDFKDLYHVENDTSTKLEILAKFNSLIELGIIFPEDFLTRASNPILPITHLLKDGNFEMLEFLIDKGLIETKDIVQKTNKKSIIKSPILDTIIIHNNLEILNKLIDKSIIFKEHLTVPHTSSTVFNTYLNYLLYNNTKQELQDKLLSRMPSLKYDITKVNQHCKNIANKIGLKISKDEEGHNILILQDINILANHIQVICETVLSYKNKSLFIKDILSRFLHRQEFNFLVEKHESKLVSINDTEYLKLSSIEGKMTAFLSKKDADQISLRFVSEAIKCIKEDSSLQLLYKHNVTNLLTTIITSEIHVCDIHYLFEVLKIVTLTLDKEMLLEIFSSTKPFLTRISDFSQRIYDPPPYKIIENLLSDYNTLEENQALRTILELLNEKINIDYSDLLNELNIKIIEQQIILSNEYQTFDDKEISNHVELVAETSEISDNVEICS